MLPHGSELSHPIPPYPLHIHRLMDLFAKFAHSALFPQIWILSPTSEPCRPPSWLTVLEYVVVVVFIFRVILGNSATFCSPIRVHLRSLRDDGGKEGVAVGS